MKSQKLLILANTHTRLKVAADMLRWAVNAETKDIVDQDEVVEMLAVIKRWSDLAFNRMMEKSEDK